MVALTSLLSVRVDFNFSDPCYVIQLASNYVEPAAPPAGSPPSPCTVAAALSNQQIKLFTSTLTDFKHCGTLQGHSERITDLSIPLPREQPDLVLSSSEDGSVLAWDCRTQTPCERYVRKNTELTSCSANTNLVVGGEEGVLWFWDRRTGKVLNKLDDVHMDSVTAVRFHPISTALCFSASDDGLVSVYNTAAGISDDDDDAFLAALNINNSPAALGFYGAGASSLWCRSATETLHLWDWQGAVQVGEDEMEGDTSPGIWHVLNARERIGAQLEPAVAEGFRGKADYLLGCQFDAATQALHVICGSHEGSVAVVPIEMAGVRDVQFQAPRLTLPKGHTDVVRASLCHGHAILTGGEDARVNVWSDPSLVDALQQAEPTLGKVSTPHAEISSRHKPY